MNRLALLAAPVLALAGMGGYATLTAQPAMEAPGKLDLKRVAPGNYTVDSAHTLVGWKVSHFAINDYFGLFGDVKGTLQIDPKALGNTRLDVTIPVSKVTVASEGLRDHLLRAGKNGAKPDFFGAAPTDARFVSTAVRRTGPMKAAITGNLTLNGVTRPVVIAAEFTGAGNSPMNKRLNIGFRGRAAINRSDFGIAYGIPVVSDRVELDISAAFEQAVAPPVSEGDRCGVSKVSDAAGRKDSPSLRADVVRKVGHSRVRWLPPGTAATMDYRPDRLNVDIDSRGIVTRLYCT